MAGNDHSPTLTLQFIKECPTGLTPLSRLRGRANPPSRTNARRSPQSKTTPRQSNHRPLLRPCFPRVKTGCLTCRRRKKKCDEAKPDCSGCRRNHEQCEWPEAALDSNHTTSALRKTSKHSIRQGDELVATSPSPVDTVGTDGSTSSRESSSPSPTHSIGLPSACVYTVSSALLFKHYLEGTGPILACVPAQESPFLTYVVPLAWNDDLLMHGVLALSGAHLACKRGFDDHIQSAAWQHYSALLRGLRVRLGNRSTEDADNALELLLVLIVLCHYEIISGDTSGNLFHHLRASRQLISSLLTRPELLVRLGENNVLLGFCLELYAYILITNSLKPQGIGPGHTLQYDSFVMCLSNLGAYATFGTMFGSCHGLLELIPQITLFSSQRVAEEEAGIILPSRYSNMMHNVLRHRIETWQLPETFTGNDYDYAMATSAAEALRSALCIYLATAMAGSLVSDPETLENIQHQIDGILDAAHLVENSRWCTIMLWPLTIAGSCMTDTFQRKRLIDRMKTSRYQMNHVFAVCEVLELLWKTDNPKAFGPYGLFLMEKRGFCVPLL